MADSFKKMLKDKLGTMTHEEFLALAKKKGKKIQNVDLTDRDAILDLIVDTLKPGQVVVFGKDIKDDDDKVIFKSGEKIEVDDLVK